MPQYTADALIRDIATLDSAVVALSGGVDSSVVAALAALGLGERALAVTATSPAMPSGDLTLARTVAAAVGIRHEVVRTAEMDRPAYRDNNRFRCYHCKSELYQRLTLLAERRGYAVVLSGANADDLGDWRPGLRAAAEHGVRHPLLDAGLGKEQVRRIARDLNLPVADRPASPCLASRLPYGTPVTIGALTAVDRAERSLRERGYRVLRVRHYGELGRIEFGAEELARVRQPAERATVLAAVRSAGYKRAEISPRPFRSGSLNVA